MPASARFWTVILLALLAGAALRLVQLDRRPMHGDEAVHAWKFHQLWRGDGYRYDPHEYHGPTLNYLTLPIVWLTRPESFVQTTEATYRLLPALCGVGMILLMPLLADGLGRRGAGLAALLLALSPAMVFYSRYYIQEMLLACFTLALVAAVWRYWQSARVAWAVVAGVAAGLMIATKETWVLSAIGMVLALVVSRACDSTVTPTTAPKATILGALAKRSVVIGVPLAIVTAACFYASFGSWPQGLGDALSWPAAYAARAGGGEGLHQHPWHYYVQILAYTHLAAGPWWSEALVLVLAIAALRGSWVHPLERFLLIYGVMLAAAYSLIPYKTPWCLVQFWWPLLIVAGCGAARLLRAHRSRTWRVACGLALVCAIAHFGWQAQRAAFRFCADARNPYVYAHPLHGVADLAASLHRLQAAQPDRKLIIKVIGDNYWPLPWYLRGFEHVGYWNTSPADPDADVIIAEAASADAVRERLRGGYRECSASLRPDVRLVVFTRIDSPGALP